MRRSSLTDDQGRFVIPELPDANYKVLVRGYGLTDSAAVDAKAGQGPSTSGQAGPQSAAADAQALSRPLSGIP